MKRLLALISLFFLVACAAHPLAVREVNPSSSSHIKAAAGGPGGVEYRYWQTNLPAITGNSQTITAFDTTAGGTQSGKYDFLQRIMVTGNCDQAVTVNYQIQIRPSTTWSLAAGTNASYAFAAGSVSEVDDLVQGQESRIQIVTGSTGPTTCPIAIALFFVRDLAQ